MSLVFSARRFALGLARLQLDIGDLKVHAFLYEWTRGKKWRPRGEDAEDHESYGFYLKRWRRRKLREIIQNDTSDQDSDTTLRLEEPAYQRDGNIDMFAMDGYYEDYESSYHEEGPKKPSKPSSKTKKKSKRKWSPNWTRLLNHANDDVWDWDDLRMMYGNASEVDAEADDIHSRRETKQQSGFNQRTFHPAISRECVVHLRVLGLPEDTSFTAEDLKQAFYKCALQWHPDRHQKDHKAQAEMKFKRVQEAYQALQSHIQ